MNDVSVNAIANLCLKLKRGFPRHMRERDGHTLTWVDGADFYALLTDYDALRAELAQAREERQREHDKFVRVNNELDEAQETIRRLEEALAKHE